MGFMFTCPFPYIYFSHFIPWHVITFTLLLSSLFQSARFVLTTALHLCGNHYKPLFHYISFHLLFHLGAHFSLGDLIPYYLLPCRQYLYYKHPCSSLRLCISVESHWFIFIITITLLFNITNLSAGLSLLKLVYFTTITLLQISLIPSVFAVP